MPRKQPKYSAKNLRKKWKSEDMIKALDSVMNQRMGLKIASKTFNVPRSTLQRFLKRQKENNLAAEEVVQTQLGRKTVLGEDIEKDLVNYILTMEAKYYGLTRKDIRRMACTLAIRNGRETVFKNGIAGRSWLDAFLRRHGSLLSVRRPTGTSFARAMGFNKKNVKEFFDNLQQEYTKHNFSPHRIFNVDETGLSVVQSKVVDVIGRKGKRQIASITSAERGSLVTLIAAMSAGGLFVPPMLIFPRKNRNDQLMRGAPPGINIRCSSEWVGAAKPFYRMDETFYRFCQTNQRISSSTSVGRALQSYEEFRCHPAGKG